MTMEQQEMKETLAWSRVEGGVALEIIRRVKASITTTQHPKIEIVLCKPLILHTQNRSF